MRTKNQTEVRNARKSHKARFLFASISTKAAAKLGLNGVHIPNAQLKNFRQSARHRLLVTVSAHNMREVARAVYCRADWVLISPIFQSESASFSKSLGPIKLAKLCAMFPNMKFAALGGINRDSIKRLRNTGIKGVAGVSYHRARALDV